MRLDALAAAFDDLEIVGRGDVDVRGVALDSRAVRPGDLFVALAGQRDDGLRYLAEAIDRGAAAIMATRVPDAVGVPALRTRDPRRLLGVVAARLMGEPSAALTLVGVTGTNGKTTTTYLVDGIWRAGGKRTGVIGTVAWTVAGRAREALHTTPDAPVLQELFREMHAAGVTHVVMEVSSHALAQQRVAGARFDAAGFTNLTHDHLDFHGDVERYFAAKASLFHEYLPQGGKPDPAAVINIDDPAGARLAATVRTRCVRVGRGAGADVGVCDVVSSLAGTRGRLIFAGNPVGFETALVGAPHVENVMLAAALTWSLGMEPAAIVEGIAAAAPPPGRVERIAGNGFTVVVDYAHTPDALVRLLEAMRLVTTGRLIVVFGCGGDRDRGKRPIMGSAAARLADITVLTSDNPRTEEPAAIVAEIEAGVRAAGGRPLADAAGLASRGYLIEVDRRAAIARGIGLARPGDLVVVAGKGHEDYQIVGTEKRHLDDREEVRRVLGATA